MTLAVQTDTRPLSEQLVEWAGKLPSDMPLVGLLRQSAIALQPVVQPRVFVAVPSGRSLPAAQTMSSMVALTRALTANSLDGGFGTLAFPDISEIRSIFLSIWFDKIGTSHLLFVDDDMSFDPQLILDMIAFNQPLVGALCPKRKLPIEFAGRAKAGNCRLINGFMEVDGIGGAVMLIRRDAVEAIINKFPEIIDNVSVKNHAAAELLNNHGVTRLIRAFDHMWVDGEKFSEDLSFCKRWAASAERPGITGAVGAPEIWANITHAVTHIGQHEYTGKYIDVVKDFVTTQEPAPVVQPIIVGEMDDNGVSHNVPENTGWAVPGAVVEPAAKKRRGRPPKAHAGNGATPVPTDVTEPAVTAE